MTSGQRWYLSHIIAQHIGSDDKEAIARYAGERGYDLVTASVPGTAIFIDELRHTVPATPATEGLKTEILHQARKGNLYDNTLTDMELKARIEREQSVSWNVLNAQAGMRLFDTFRAKRAWLKRRHRWPT